MTTWTTWNHRIEVIAYTYKPLLERCKPGGNARCNEPLAYLCSYSYVTGRGGRTTTRRKYYCRFHASSFALKHGLELPPDPAATGGAR